MESTGPAGVRTEPDVEGRRYMRWGRKVGDGILMGRFVVVVVVVADVAVVSAVAVASAVAVVVVVGDARGGLRVDREFEVDVDCKNFQRLQWKEQ